MYSTARSDSLATRKDSAPRKSTRKPKAASKPRKGKATPPPVVVQASQTGPVGSMTLPMAPAPRDLTGQALLDHIRDLATQFIPLLKELTAAWLATETMDEDTHEATMPERDKLARTTYAVERMLTAAILRLHNRIPSLDTPLPPSNGDEPKWKGFDLSESTASVFVCGRLFTVGNDEGNVGGPGGKPVLSVTLPALITCLDDFDGEPEGCALCGIAHINHVVPIERDEPEASPAPRKLNVQEYESAREAYQRFRDSLDERYWVPFTTTVQDIQHSMSTSRNTTVDEWIAEELEDYNAGEKPGVDWVIWQAERCLAIIRSGPDGKGEVVRLADAP